MNTQTKVAVKKYAKYAYYVAAGVVTAILLFRAGELLLAWWLANDIAYMLGAPRLAAHATKVYALMLGVLCLAIAGLFWVKKTWRSAYLLAVLTSAPVIAFIVVGPNEFIQVVHAERSMSESSKIHRPISAKAANEEDTAIGRGGITLVAWNDNLYGVPDGKQKLTEIAKENARFLNTALMHVKEIFYTLPYQKTYDQKMVEVKKEIEVFKQKQRIANGQDNK